MRILFLGNNKLAVDILGWLVERQEDQVVGLVVHERKPPKYKKELIRISGLPQSSIYHDHELRSPVVLNDIKSLGAEVALSVLYGDIMRPDFLYLFGRRVLNLHPAYLPYGRGANPNVWAIIKQFPAGTTLHLVDEGIDTGPILAQKKVKVTPDDTGRSLYEKLMDTSYNLFVESWPLFCSGKLLPKPQPKEGTTHKTKNLSSIDQLNLEENMKVGHLINMLRARTFPPYQGMWFEVEGKRYQVSIDIKPIDEDLE